MSIKTNYLMFNSRWGLAYSEQVVHCARIYKSKDRIQITVYEELEDFNAVKRIYNNCASSFIHPFLPRQTLPEQSVNISTITLPFSNRTDINEAWKEYLPSHQNSKGIIHKKKILSKKQNESSLQIFSLQEIERSAGLTKQTPLPLAFLGLSKLLDFDKSMPMTFLHFTDNFVYSTTIQNNTLLSYEYFPHLSTKKSQLHALSLKHNNNPPSLYLSGQVSTTDRELVKLYFQNSKMASIHKSLKSSQALIEKHSVLIGCTMLGFTQSYHKVFFINKKADFKLVYNQVKRPMLLLYMISIICFTAMLLSGYQSYTKNETALKEALFNLHKSSPQAIPQFDLSTNKHLVFTHLNAALNNSSKLKLPYHLIPSQPDLSELFYWLQSYPSEQLRIKNFSYKLVERPSSKAPHRSYSAKISMEITSDDPDLAEDFQKSLINKSGFVNKKKPFSWRANEHHYLVSFYLSHRRGT